MLKRVKDIFCQHITSVTRPPGNDSVTDSSTTIGSNATKLSTSDQLRNMPCENWMTFLVNLCNDIKYLLIRGQDVVDIFENNLCSNHQSNETVENSTVILSTNQPLTTISVHKAKELAKCMHKTLWNTANISQKRLCSIVSSRFRLGSIQLMEPKLMTSTALSSTVDLSVNSPNLQQRHLSTTSIMDIPCATVFSEYVFDKFTWSNFRELVKILSIFQVYVLRAWLKFSDIPIKAIICHQSNDSENCLQPNVHSFNKSKSCVKKSTIPLNQKTSNDVIPSSIISSNTNDCISNNQYIFNIQSDLILRDLVLDMIILIIDRFHRENYDKINMLLDQERWQAAICPEQVQQMINDISIEVGHCKMKSSQLTNEHSPCTPNHNNLIQSTDSVVSTSNYVFLKNEEYTVVRTVILLLPIINDYVKLDEKLPGQPLTTEFVSDRLADLLNHFNSRVCQLVLGAEACKRVDLQRISAKNLALTLRSLQLVVQFLPCIQFLLNRISKTEFNKSSPTSVDNLLIASLYHSNSQGINRITLNGLDHIEKLFNEHIESILQKLVQLLSDPIGPMFSNWYGRPPIPSKQMDELCRNLSKLIGMTKNVLPAKTLTVSLKE
ncbi:Vacuolar protein sorting-associated protein 54 [Schistosoma haematobium]|uniref:Vacuolar protein sorting-associated protein 54 n=1 Tax=Schistosoma haematobium TaxID=6185 RepID=A0A922LV30_SCHHA|nr:Vacuolar protein sorting-associated protein 54 [Schistosoma haematobium]KAH9594157.1 Vacuolar protein sorting-associated protein 54 [Schistosoma haematobium]